MTNFSDSQENVRRYVFGKELEVNILIGQNLFGWIGCAVAVSGETKLVVTTAVGPRVVWLGHADDEINFGTNIFGGFPAQMGKCGEPDFQFRMGERFWLAPEEAGPKTYDPDNQVVEEAMQDGDKSITLVQKSGFAGLQKSIKVEEAQDGVWISRKLNNAGKEAVNGVALWGLSGMALNGTAIIHRPAFQYHPAFVKPGAKPEQIGGFLAAQNMSIWPYTNFQDPRLTLGRKFIFLRQDPGVSKDNVNKFGLSDVYWVAYLVKTKAGARLFIKRIYFEKDQQHTHPDRGVVFETFVCKDFLELEETGPLEKLVPGACATPLTDRWSVYKVKRMPGKLTEGWVDDNVIPLVGSTSQS